MKARVYVRLKTEVLDPQGEAVRRALARAGLGGIRSVRIGKLLELEVDAPDESAARALVLEAAESLLANPVMEDYEVEVGSDA